MINERLGSCQRWQKTALGLHIEADNAVVEVEIFRKDIVRVRIARQLSETFSYAVVAEPEQGAFRVEEEKDRLLLKTSALTLEIGMAPIGFRLLTPKGQLLNADDAAFSTSWQGNEVTTYKALQDGERFIGLGEKTGGLDRRGSAYTNWNTDYFGYPANGDPLYATIPFYIGIHSGLSYGLFFDNSYKTRFNFGASNDRFASFGAESGEMDYYLFAGDVREIIEGYTWLTGRMELPPLWSLGYQQCRYSYYPESEMLTLARTFREKDIPADLLYFDIHYMDEYKVFTWDKTRFPQPKRMLAKLKELGFRTAVIVDPGIKIEAGYRPYEEGLKKDHFARYPDGQPYSGEVWPGWCHFPDFTRAETRRWWGRSFAGYVRDGLQGFWNDMNEPAAWGNSVPDLVEFDWEGERTSHKQAHNVYGLQMARSTREGVKKLMDGQRAFVLTRAAYAGIQRYAAIWTGDNVASDEHMLAGVRLLNSLGLSGASFAGYDIGGFAGDASPALFARWVSLGAFAPFARGHSMINSRDAEPWAFGEEVEAIARNYIKLRYRLLPYLYAAFYASAESGLPVVRSLAIDYAHDAAIYDVADQYFFGDAILVAPLESTKDIARVYLPRGTWYDFYNDRKEKGGQQIYAEAPMERLPLFVKAGSIIPMQETISHTGEDAGEVLYIHIYAGGTARFVYYEDDGETYENEKGQYYRRVFEHGRGRLVLGATEGKYASKFKRAKVYLHGYGKIKGARIDGKGATLTKETLRQCAKLASFDPLDKEDRDPYGAIEITAVEVSLRKREMVVEWN